MVWMWVPRAVAPTEVPALQLSPSSVARIIEAQRALAASAPSTDRIKELVRLLEQQNRAEARGDNAPERSQARRKRIAEAREEVQSAQGPQAIAAVRARWTERAMRVVKGSASEEASEEHAEVLGSFDQAMSRYGLRDLRGLRASRFAVRTLFKAHWNALVGLSPTEGFASVELQSYWGWLALQADDAPLSLRRQALQAYAKAGGPGAFEAGAVFAFGEGDFRRAAELFRLAYQNVPSLRLRNHLLAAEVAAAR